MAVQKKYKVHFRYADGKTDYVVLDAASPTAAKRQAHLYSTRPIKIYKVEVKR